MYILPLKRSLLVEESVLTVSSRESERAMFRLSLNKMLVSEVVDERSESDLVTLLSVVVQDFDSSCYAYCQYPECCTYRPMVVDRIHVRYCFLVGEHFVSV